MTRRLAYTRGQLDRSALTDDGPLRFVASSTGVNRYGFALRNDGWLLDNYQRNPVFLWAHDSSTPPIGRAMARLEPPELAAYVTFDREDPFSAGIEGKYRRGFMTAVSVGLDFVNADGSPIEDWWRLDKERIQSDSFYDLAEISAVPVPADPRALRQNHRAGLSYLGRQLVELFDEQERGEATVDELGAAVRAELARLGFDLAAIPSHHTAVVEGEWDGPAAVAACAAERSALRAIHAWVDSDGDQDAKASYKFPHHAKPGGPANLNGVRNALARLSQANIPDADRAAVEKHLRAHLNDQPGRDDGEMSADPATDSPPRTGLAGIDRVAADAVLAAFTI